MASAKQIAARKLFASRFGGKGRSSARHAKKERKMANRRSRSRSRTKSGTARRFGHGIKTTHLLTAGGAVLGTYGIVGPKQPGWSWDIDPRTSESMADRIHNVTQSIPLYGTDPNEAQARAAVGTGIGLIVLSKVAPMIMPSLKRLKFKLGSGRNARRLAVFG